MELRSWTAAVKSGTTGMMCTDLTNLIKSHGSRQRLWDYLFFYKEGKLFWRNPRAPRHKPGDIAGWLNGRYWTVNIANTTVYVHVIIYEMHHGDVTEGLEVDHKDINSCNNLIDNLRIATRTLNVRNINRRKDNTSGVTGVIPYKGNWRAQIRVNSRQITLGCFPDMFDAICARKSGENKLWTMGFGNNGTTN